MKTDWPVNWPDRWDKKTKVLGTKPDWNKFRRNSILMEGIQTPHQVWDIFFVRCLKYTIPLELMADDPLTGLPEGMYVDGFFITAGSMKHALHASRIRSHWVPSKEPIRVLEIGGGYGGMMSTLSRMYKVQSYTIVDMEPVHKIQEAYISGWVKTQNAEDFHRVYITPDNLDQVEEVDIAISSHCLVEIPYETMCRYINLIQDCLVPDGVFYSVNNPRRAVNPKDFPFDDKWEFKLQGTKESAHPSYSEILGVRKER